MDSNMSLDEGGSSKETSGSSGGESGSESFESGSSSFDSSTEQSSFSSSDSLLESSVGFDSDPDTELNSFSSTDSQLEGDMLSESSHHSSTFASSDAQLSSSFVGEEQENSENLSVEAQTENTEEHQPEITEASKEADVKEASVIKSEEANNKAVQPFEDSDENNEYLKPYNEQLYLNDRILELRGDPEKAAEVIGKNNLRERIERDTMMSKESYMNSQYSDITRAKGFLQEEMIKNVLGEDFEVSDHTVKSVHKDGSITYTDIEATAKQDVEISDGVVVLKDEKIAIESKAGDEKYLSSQIDHIDKQLEGMPEDAHRMLFVTADVNRLSAEDKAHLGEVLDKNNAVMNVLPYYAYDLTDTIMHMDVKAGQESLGENAESEQADELAPTEDSVEYSEIENAETEFSFNSVINSIFGKQEHEAGDDSDNVDERSLQSHDVSDEANVDVNDESATLLREQEKLEADTEIVTQLIKENKQLKSLSDEERESVINVAVAKAMEHDPELTLENAEEYRSKIQFVDLNEVATENNVDPSYAKRIQGYYSPETGMKINVDAYGAKTDETLVTINHETMHMLAQRYDENNEAIQGMTGLKRNDLIQSANNTGMNEGVTEMYASRNMAELLPEREERSYIEEVNIMTKYEAIVGADVLHDAYMVSGADILREDFDQYMGNGQFDSFCQTMDKMLIAEKSRSDYEAEILRQKLDTMLNEYAKRKGSSVIGQD